MGEWKKVKDNRPIVIRARESGDEITRCWGINTAKEIIEEFENEDKKDGIYEENFYEIYNDRTKEVVL